MLKVLKYLSVALIGATLWGCDDEEGVGSSIQPAEDVLCAYSNRLDVETSSILSDTVLSKYENLLLGRYVDPKFGESVVEFFTQLDARVGALNVPETVVVNSSSSSAGILNTLLTDIDSRYGEIEEIVDASDVVVDSTQFYLAYSSDFFGDSIALQSFSVYELNESLKEMKAFTNESVKNYCDKSKLLGSLSFQIQNKRELRIPLDNEVGERILSAYQKGTKVSTQQEFNELFKGVYVNHSFNQGTVLQVTVSGIQVFYHFDAKIKTTFNGESVTVRASEVKTKDGKLLNPLVSSVFLSANKTVKRVNMVQQEDLENLLPSLNESPYTYTYTPAGLYTSVHIPFDALMDSVAMNAPDKNKVFFNSAKLIFHRKELDWNTKLKSSAYLMLIDRSRVVDFFYNNEQPDGVSSFIAAIDTSANAYIFNITAPIQNKMRGSSETYGEDLVLVPVVRRVDENDNYYYRQQLWLTSTMLCSPTHKVNNVRPRLDVVYTRRE